MENITETLKDEGIMNSMKISRMERNIIFHAKEINFYEESRTVEFVLYKMNSHLLSFKDRLCEAVKILFECDRLNVTFRLIEDTEI